MCKTCVDFNMKFPPNQIRGRGASDNPQNRFEGHYIEYEPEDEGETLPGPETQLFKDDTKEIISWNKSPDIPFQAAVNPYRGCEHGCIYCYARPFHEYLGFSSGLDFETKIMVKYNAPELLRTQFRSPKWEPQVVAMSGITDVYQPIERNLELTRKCLEVFVEFRNPVGIITKNYLVTRDIDLLKELAEYKCVKVNISITTLDKSLSLKMEPRTSVPARRLKAIERLANAGIPVGVLVAPIIPGLTDHELANILREAANAGAESAGYTMLRLPHKVKDLFCEWLARQFPDRRDKIMNRIKHIRNGAVTNSEFGKRMRGEGNFFYQIEQTFAIHTHKLGLDRPPSSFSVNNFRKSHGEQLSFFS